MDRPGAPREAAPPPAPQPRIIGATTPRTATRNADGPTRRKSARLASRPTWKSSMMIPIWARCSIEIPAGGSGRWRRKDWIAWSILRKSSP